MSKKIGKQMKNLPRNYIYAMDELQNENQKLRETILELESKLKNNVALANVSQQRELLIAFYRSIDNGDYLYPEDCKYHVGDFLESN